MIILIVDIALLLLGGAAVNIAATVAGGAVFAIIVMCWLAFRKRR